MWRSSTLVLLTVLFARFYSSFISIFFAGPAFANMTHFSLLPFRCQCHTCYTVCVSWWPEVVNWALWRPPIRKRSLWIHGLVQLSLLFCLQNLVGVLDKLLFYSFYSTGHAWDSLSNRAVGNVTLLGIEHVDDHQCSVDIIPKVLFHRLLVPI